MAQTALRPHEQRMPPALNIIALATFAASLSARALDPVLPRVAAMSITAMSTLPRAGILALRINTSHSRAFGRGSVQTPIVQP
jgi:hypothetical protein